MATTGTTFTNKVFTCSGNQEQARFCAQDILKIKSNQYIYVARREHILGVRNARLYLFGTYYTHLNFAALLETARSRDFKIIEIIEKITFQQYEVT